MPRYAFTGGLALARPAGGDIVHNDLMLEVPCAGKDHRDAVLVAGFY